MTQGKKKRTSAITSICVYKNWYYTRSGERQGAREVKARWGFYTDLISNYYLNRKKDTKTLYALVWDLDVDKADPKWLDTQGRLDWKDKILPFLMQRHPEVFSYSFGAVRSSGGKGLAILLGISPMEIVAKTERAQMKAQILQYQIFRLFQHYGLGADPGALGLLRDLPNWRDPRRQLRDSAFMLKTVQKERRPVITELLAVTSNLPMIKPPKKREQGGLIHYHARVESKWAKLYLYLVACMYGAQLKTSEVQKITGLCLQTIRTTLGRMAEGGQELGGIFVKRLSKVDGWQIDLDPLVDLSERAQLLQTKAPGLDTTMPLVRPQLVEDGERNFWISRAAIRMKHAGIELEEAKRLLAYHVSKIPGAETSQNCRHFAKVLESIYQSRPELFGSRPGRIEGWLAYAPNYENHYGLMENAKTPKKGTLFPSHQSGFIGTVHKAWKYRKNWYLRVELQATFEVWSVVLPQKKGQSFVKGTVIETFSYLKQYEEIRRNVFVERYWLAEAKIIGFDIPTALTDLPGIGPALAERIFDKFRFRSFSALAEGKSVRGLGTKKLAKIQEALRLKGYKQG